METPISFTTILVISGSTVFRHLLRSILSPHADDVLIACDLNEGRAWLARRSVDVVICEEILRDGGAFDLLDEVADIGSASAEWVLVTSDPSEASADRAIRKGVAGYLTKPVSFRDIAGTLKSRRAPTRAPRRRPGGRVSLLGVDDQIDTPEGESPQLMWYARDVSTTGAFLETESPLPIGSRLDLFIEIGCIRIRVKAVVVRIQEPTWQHGGGIGVEFFEYGDSARQTLATYASGGGADTY